MRTSSDGDAALLSVAVSEPSMGVSEASDPSSASDSAPPSVPDNHISRRGENLSSARAAKAEAQAKKKPITVRPADLLKPEWETLRSDALKLENCKDNDEDVLTFAMFPQVAPKFFKTRPQGPLNLGADQTKAAPVAAPATAPGAGAPAKANGATKPVTYVVTLQGKEHKVTVATPQ